MKRKLQYMVGTETVEKDVNYIPVRFILAVLLAVLETLAVIAIVVLLCLYRSLAHHFENGLWMYKCDSVGDIRKDFSDTFDKSILIKDDMLKKGLLRSLTRSLVKIFAPML